MRLPVISVYKGHLKAVRHTVTVVSRCLFSHEIDNKYSAEEKLRIIKVINDSDIDVLSRYDITKNRLKKLTQWRSSNGHIKTLADVELIESFSEKPLKKLFNSILEGPKDKPKNLPNKIKGQILFPPLSDVIRRKCRSVLAVYVTVNSVCWTLIDKSSYKVTEWKYYGIDYRDGKKLQITDILDIAQTVTNQLPEADIYVMKAEATTLRAAGSDPNNPKILAVNLQKVQMVAMIIALISNRQSEDNIEIDEEKCNTENISKHKVYFLRPTLPYRLYGTLVGNERVSTDQTIEMLLQKVKENCNDNSEVYISEELKSMFRSQKELQKDMLGHCLLLGLTFMDLCIYKNQNSINKLLKRGE